MKRQMMKLVPKCHQIQYIFIAALLLIDFIIIQAPTIIPRSILAALLLSSFWIPYIRKFTLPALPIFTWLITFYACQFIPIDYRPNHIFVNLLPTLERILYGANLSEVISKHTHPVLDILAWLPYGVIHFSFPFILALLLFVFGPPGCLKVYGAAFGYMNLAGVLTQLLFPNASPWYELSYGSAPADYSIPGEPGGLIRIDKILGLDLYGSTFGSSPLVFGAFPSLHSGSATIEMLFVVYLCPKLKPLAIAYVMWMWFATMYLTHHYMIDLVGGSIYAIVTFAVAQNFLPSINPECRTRMQYLGATKLSIRSLIYSIEHDDVVLEQITGDEEAALLKHRPEPLVLSSDAYNIAYDDTYSPTSSVYTSEPDSPVTPHSPILNQFDFTKYSN
ncbi:hypothetical protein RMATCC62417_03710 [Rhizopus microsporus]|nr:hypothetical protein RMATCC62417_03710 [Rhizopus microsporus]